MRRWPCSRLTANGWRIVPRWASVQTGSTDVWRVDVGPSLSASVQGIRIEADWRQRVGGNVAPGSGPTLTVSAGF